MKIVYLDHFAAIEVSDTPSSEIWVEIRDLLFHLVNSGDLICPISFDTYIELTKSNFEVAKSRSEVLSKLSKGKSFRQEMTALYEIIDAHSKSIEVNSKTYLVNSNDSFFKSFKNYQEIKQLRINFDKDIVKHESEIEELNKLRRLNATKNITINHSIDLQKHLIGSRILTRLNKLLLDKRIIVKESVFSNSQTNGHWIDLLLNYLVKIKNFSYEELIIFKDHLMEFGISKIAPLDIKSKMFALRAFKKLKGNTNDQIDIKRISIGLPSSDYLLTDRQRKSEIIELKLDKEYNCHIFSGRQRDLELFRDELLYLKNTAYNIE